MTRWWKTQGVRVRLTLWYAGVTAAVLLVFAVLFYHLLQQRLAAEIDRQLRIDFDLIEAQVEPEPSGKMRWLLRGSHGDEGYARLSAWFEVWAEDGELLLRHWPVPETRIHRVLPAPKATTLQFYTAELDPGLHVRIMERPARIFARGVILRVFRDETEMRRTLHDMVEVFALGLPLAVVLAAIGGYFIASRSLAPVAAMAEQARQITSELLSARLPVKNAGDEVGRLALVFNDTLARLEKSFEGLRRFSADASHELRSPLTALRTVGEVGLREARTETELRETIASMLEEAQHLADLVESLLALARLEDGAPIARRETVSVGDLVAEVQSHLDVLSAEKRQDLKVQCEADLCFEGDAILIRHALTNIVHNAIRYSPAATEIRIEASQQNGSVCIEVKDEGPGISPEHQAAVFERFFRVDKARSREQGAFGLGLAIAKRSVELHRGRLELESTPGRGSLFRMVLPIS
jgi:heavy metal sensor kinase